jgi:hypothetical protein
LSDEIQYDYKSMDHAFEEMLRVNSQIGDAAHALEGDARMIMQGMAGAVIDGYEMRSGKLTTDVGASNDYLHQVAMGLQAGFDAMHHADIKLGDGMG